MKFQTKEIVLQRERGVSSHSKSKRLIFITPVLVAVLIISFLSFSSFASAQERKEYSTTRHSILASVSSFFKSLLFSSVKQKDDSQSAEVVPIKSQSSSPVIPLEKGIQATSGKLDNPQLTNSTSSNANLDSRLRGNDRSAASNSIASSVTRKEVETLIKQSDNRNIALIRSVLTSPNPLSNTDSLSVQQSLANLSQRISVMQENNVRQLDHTYNSISRSFDDITSLDGVTMTNSSFSGTTGTFTGTLTGTSGTFSGNLTTNSQLTVSGTATSTITGDTSFDSGTLYIDSISNRVGIASSSPSETLSINGATYLSQISAPSVTTDRLYNTSGDLYWNGNLIGSASVGNWTSAGGNVYRSSGNIGIGTTSPYAKLSVVGETVAEKFTATSTTATSTFAGGISFSKLSDARNPCLTIGNTGGVATTSCPMSVSVDNYGAIGDGVTDDSDAIQRAIATGKSIHFTSGNTYLVSEPITLVASTTVYGNGATIKRAAQINTTTSTTITSGVTNSITVADASAFRVNSINPQL